MGGSIVVTSATVVADGTMVLAGATVGAAISASGASFCAPEPGNGYKRHHIATVENSISDRSGGPWTPRFESLFRRAGMTLKDPANKVNLLGHFGPHPPAYHVEVFRAIQDGLGNCATPAACRPLLLHALQRLGGEICTPGSMLNRLITR